MISQATGDMRCRSGELQESQRRGQSQLQKLDVAAVVSQAAGAKSYGKRHCRSAIAMSSGTTGVLDCRSQSELLEFISRAKPEELHDKGTRATKNRKN